MFFNRIRVILILSKQMYYQQQPVATTSLAVEDYWPISSRKVAIKEGYKPGQFHFLGLNHQILIYGDWVGIHICQPSQTGNRGIWWYATYPPNFYSTAFFKTCAELFKHDYEEEIYYSRHSKSSGRRSLAPLSLGVGSRGEHVLPPGKT